MNISAYFAEPM